MYQCAFVLSVLLSVNSAFADEGLVRGSESLAIEAAKLSKVTR